MMETENPDIDTAFRQDWMKTLACAKWEDLKAVFHKSRIREGYEVLRQPETGLVMVRPRMGGTGRPFNAGEATVTRCSVRNENGFTGHAYVMGRNKDHALAAARIDAEMQDESQRKMLTSEIIRPLKELSAQRREHERRKTAATKVEFFTLVRGEDE